MIIPANLLNKLGSFKISQDSFARIGGAELSVDGFLSSGTAALFEPYASDPSVNGKLLCTPLEMKTSAGSVLKAGLHLVIHAMGDKAIDSALTIIEALEWKGRHRLDQAALFNKDLIQRAQKQQVIISVQPLVGASEFSVYYAIEHLGKKRARLLYPLKTLFKKGICVCGGSDCPMEPLNPLLGIQSVVTRQFFPQERLTVDESLRLYTVNAAHASDDEDKKGSIQEGKFADFAVLSNDPHGVPPSKLHEIRVEMTIVGGKVTFSERR
jgi:hypothetical protein